MEELIVGTRVDHPRYGEGIVSKNNLTAYEIFFERGGKIEITKRNTDLTVLEPATGEAPRKGINLRELEEVMIYILDKYQGILPKIELGDKWVGGTLEIKPANPELKPKEIPIDVFFHKIVMVRDRLRVLEQNINSSTLSDEEKVNLQQYITRIYGSLTTFNVLFANKEDYFIGMKS
ncbi:MAG: hypothetical protein JXR31_09050 [Prolixibacteraceae bacterium]|nr:hypothetical protein [Prolixibacteraceae bacterium]MBN2774380.1 hypothetical protein [Prolixibacteraceae bacterium]